MCIGAGGFFNLNYRLQHLLVMQGFADFDANGIHTEVENSCLIPLLGEGDVKVI